MITITLNQILAQNPCADGWAKILHARGKINAEQLAEFLSEGEVPLSFRKLADDEAFPLALALESNGLDDVLWSLRCLPDDHRLWRKYAVWCARQVRHLMTDPRSVNALDVAWRHSDGLATDEELTAARRAAYAYAAADADAADAVLALIAENDGLRDGLSDIAKKASESRSLTRRLTWIEGRAESALLGKPWAAHVFMMPDPKNGKPKAERLEAENKQLRAEVEALRKGLADARYRIEQGRVWAGTKWQLTGLHPHGQQKALDAIDAAMSSGDKSGG